MQIDSIEGLSYILPFVFFVDLMTPVNLRGLLCSGHPQMIRLSCNKSVFYYHPQTHFYLHSLFDGDDHLFTMTDLEPMHSPLFGQWCGDSPLQLTIESTFSFCGPIVVIVNGLD